MPSWTGGIGRSGMYMMFVVYKQDSHGGRGMIGLQVLETATLEQVLELDMQGQNKLWFRKYSLNIPYRVYTKDVNNVKSHVKFTPKQDNKLL